MHLTLERNSTKL